MKNEDSQIYEIQWFLSRRTGLSQGRLEAIRSRSFGDRAEPWIHFDGKKLKTLAIARRSDVVRINEINMSAAWNS